MNNILSLDDIAIRTELLPGDIGFIIYQHGLLYSKEYNYKIVFETYVAEGLCEFYSQYNPANNRIWMCSHKNKLMGSLLLMNRGESAQLRYFLIDPEYRGIGLGKKLARHYMEFLKSCGYRHSFLWTTNELPAAASLYKRMGFKLTEEKASTAFGKSLIEQRYDLFL